MMLRVLFVFNFNVLWRKSVQHVVIISVVVQPKVIKGCCPKRYPVCCSTQCCSSGSYCCGEKCCRRDTITGRLFEIPDGITKSNRYRQMMLKTHAN
ncbi:unnamed protein product [Adineta ricciae]|uniref:Cysteine rich secreted protein n=1 Tax=Adineta ricciae TaxID=249248 RepID=A0A815AEB6_ADIRI|nr:unnamed protein product [Adineta ricciae]